MSFILEDTKLNLTQKGQRVAKKRPDGNRVNRCRVVTSKITATCRQTKMEPNKRQKYKLRNETGKARTLATLRKQKEERKKY